MLKSVNSGLGLYVKMLVAHIKILTIDIDVIIGGSMDCIRIKKGIRKRDTGCPTFAGNFTRHSSEQKFTEKWLYSV